MRKLASYGNQPVTVCMHHMVGGINYLQGNGMFSILIFQDSKHPQQTKFVATPKNIPTIIQYLQCTLIKFH